MNKKYMKKNEIDENCCLVGKIQGYNEKTITKFKIFDIEQPKELFDDQIDPFETKGDLKEYSNGVIYSANIDIEGKIYQCQVFKIPERFNPEKKEKIASRFEILVIKSNTEFIRMAVNKISQNIAEGIYNANTPHSVYEGYEFLSDFVDFTTGKKITKKTFEISRRNS
jgi:hypothetical protein